MKIGEEKKIAIFAGTTEGRLLAERLAGSNVRADVFVATEYGKEDALPGHSSAPEGYGSVLLCPVPVRIHR